MANITDKQLTARASGKDSWLSEVAIWGHGSLAARITASGERLFYFRYQNSRAERINLPIGTYSRDGAGGTMTLADARLRAQQLASLHKSGQRDIKEHLEAEEADRRAAQAAERARQERERLEAEAAAERLAARLNVRQLFERWATVDLINRKDGGKEVRRMFEKDVLPTLGSLPIEEVRKRHITEVTDALLARGVNRMAKVIFSLMRQMFRFAVDRDLLEFDPTANIRKVKIGGKDVERDRVLSDEEIRQLSRQLPDAGMSAMAEAAIWIALSTCCRIGELLEARWEHVDLENGTWLIPAPKNKRAHKVYLSDFAKTQFRRLHAMTGDGTWIYPNSDEDGPVCSKTVTKQIGDRQRDPTKAPMSGRSKKCEALRLPGGKWTPHDLRRTGATLMTMLGVLPEVAERCLNHLEENKVKRIYQRHSYEKEMCAAWALLGERLSLLTEAGTENVVLLRVVRH